MTKWTGYMPPVTESVSDFLDRHSFLCVCLQVSDLWVDEVAFNQAVISNS
jgi:hypothetical protein